MSLFELILLAPVHEVETLSDALDALDALSVSVEDADAHTPAEQALFGEPGMPPPKAGWERSRIVALFATEALARDAAALLRPQDFFAGCHVVAIQAVPEQDWVRLTQSQFTPVEITPEFWIVPTWHEPPAQAKQVIRLDPGLAFGTGTHPTTRMCLRWIAAPGRCRASRWAGCSTTAAAPASWRLARPSSARWRLTRSISTRPRWNRHAPMPRPTMCSCSTGLPDKAVGSYQTVLANILATPLRVLAPLLCGHVAARRQPGAGGHSGASGR